jgi:hypothetical protein
MKKKSKKPAAGKMTRKEKEFEALLQRAAAAMRSQKKAERKRLAR